MHLTTKERILLHLLECSRSRESFEVPREQSQAGVARGADVGVRHIAQFVDPLVRENLVRVRLAHVRGFPRRRKVYELTDDGMRSAIRLRELVKSETIRFRDGDALREATVAEVLQKVPKQASVLEVVRQVGKTGFVEIESLSRAPTRFFIEQMTDAPRPEAFVGREAELEEVTREHGDARIFVVRGVAGIGKSSFAAQSCVRLHGSRNLFWHRVRTWDTNRSLLSSLGHFLEALGRPGLRAVVGRGDLPSVPQVLREDLPGSRAFLVFDDAHEATPDASAFFRTLREAMVDADDVRALVLARKAVPFYDRRDVTIAHIVREIDLGGLRPGAVAELAKGQADAASLVELSQRVGGHPLFLALARAHPGGPQEAVQDLHRFLEEEVYGRLNRQERRLMKIASLYRISVPREALCHDSEASYDALLSLVDQSLLRTEGSGGFGVHDTIREFFGSTLTPGERNEMTAIAVDELRRLAAEARRKGDFLRCIDLLSNAIELSATDRERHVLKEALGDAHKSAGDLRGAVEVYRSTARGTRDREATARLHRKIAEAYSSWFDAANAPVEIHEALRLLGEGSGVERGWIELLRCHLASRAEDWETAREHGGRALRIFDAAAEPNGRAKTLANLARIEIHAPRGDAGKARDYLAAAMKDLSSVDDVAAIISVHDAMARLLAFRLGDVDRAMVHVAAMEALPEVMHDPTARVRVLTMRGWLTLDFRGDISSARAVFRELLEIAGKVRDRPDVGSAREGLAAVDFYEGRFDEARKEFERCGWESLEQGQHGPAVEDFWSVAECSLLLGDIVGLSRIARMLDDARFARGIRDRWVLATVVRAVRRFIDRDREGCWKEFQEAFEYIGEPNALDRVTGAEVPPISKGHLLPARRLFPYVPHLYGGAILLAAGRTEEGRHHLALARHWLGVQGRNARLSVLSQHERQLVEVFGRVASTQAPSNL